MRFTHYHTISPLTGEHLIEFDASHFRYKGMMPTSIGMPLLEAYELINEWNRNAQGKYVYWL